ncbi:sensor histidine kinase [Paenibacillus glycinis]|uniref:histidine kinase n=1 Tax=Paenibacillus glycinis TaxID=2697035 RepID=A0ABW9XKV6_9BACL|nr:HAMP domain-containing sensor histidine kinase [Paenibacillus glycinis]NBD23236.1 GHKL domain-containing protein [Paenibacillus glycinis]
MSEFIRFFETHTGTIIENWIYRMETAYPGQNNLDLLRALSKKYIVLIADIDIPLDHHPIYREFEVWCENLLQQKVTIDQVLKSSAFFREAFIDAIAEFDAERSELMRLIACAISRIDTFQATIYTYFWKHAHGKIQAQDKLIEDMHDDKLNLIGKMASSMAHEIRNPLTTIKGFFVLVRKLLPPDELGKIDNYLDIIDHEFRNIEMQITGFLSFSRKPIADEDSIVTPLNELIEKTLLLVSPLLLNENIDLSLSLQEGIRVKIQKVSVVQVFSNLLNNAIDALREGKGDRKIIVLTYADDAYTYVRISNTGPEIPQEMQQRLFAPFVTSKSDGTGLGLAICKQIVERNGGTISFESNRHETSFTVRLNSFLDE